MEKNFNMPGLGHLDIRWHQRLDNFQKALNQLKKAVCLSQERELSLLEKQGLIQAFEFTHELAWNCLKDFFLYQGNPEIRGSRDAFREGIRQAILDNGQVWMDMIQARNDTSHAYDETLVSKIEESIEKFYLAEFIKFESKMLDLRNDSSEF